MSTKTLAKKTVKKRVTKKVAKKKTVPSQLKHGDYVIGWDVSDSGDPCFVTGRVIEKDGSYYLASDIDGTYWEGNSKDNFNYEYRSDITLTGNKTIHYVDDLDLENIEIVDKRKFDKLVAHPPVTDICGYSARKIGNHISFGCGDLEATIEEVRTLYKELSGLSKSTLRLISGAKDESINLNYIIDELGEIKKLIEL